MQRPGDKNTVYELVEQNRGQCGKMKEGGVHRGRQEPGAGKEIGFVRDGTEKQGNDMISQKVLFFN